MNGKSNPMNIVTACTFWDDNDVDDYNIVTLSEMNWTELSSDDLLDHFGYDGSEYVVTDENEATAHYWPCDVVEKEDEEGSNFIVRIFQRPSEEKT